MYLIDGIQGVSDQDIVSSINKYPDLHLEGGVSSTTDFLYLFFHFLIFLFVNYGTKSIINTDYYVNKVNATVCMIG